MFVRTLSATAAAALTAAALTACGGVDPDPQVTGANLTLDYFGDTDVIGFRMTLERVACAAGDAFEPATLVYDLDLIDGIMPGMVDLLEQRLDPNSRHLGSDLFVSLEPGCYALEAAPASDFSGGDFAPSVDCRVARAADPIVVVDGQTAEPPLLISQCAGDALGAVDTPVALNTPPLVEIAIDDSKFAYECQSVTVCATATDDNDDAIELEWSRLAGPQSFAFDVGPMELVGFESGRRIWQQCAEITNRFTGDYTFQVTAWDLGRRDGETVRMEALVAPAESSHALSFPLYVNWVEDPLCYDAEGALVSAGAPIERVPGCGYTTTEQFYCSDMFEARSPGSRAFTCPDGEFVPEAIYPDCG